MSKHLAPTQNIEAFESWSHTYNDSIVTLMQEKFGINYKDFIRKVANIASPKPHDKILDAATGPGTVALALSNLTNNTCKIIGIDISESMLAYAKENVKKVGLEDKIAFQIANVEELPFETNTFDIAVSSLIIHHTNDMQALQEMIRVLKPGGNLTVADVTANDNWRRREEGLIFRGMDRIYMIDAKSDDLSSKFHTCSEWEDMAKELGLVGVKTFEFPPKYSWSRGIIIISGRKPHKPLC